MYAEKAEAETNKAAMIFNCAQRELLSCELLLGARLTRKFIQVLTRTRSSGCPRFTSGKLNFRRFEATRTLIYKFCSTLVVGLKYPIYAASLLGFWSLSRIFYTRGYTTGDAKKVSIASHCDTAIHDDTYNPTIKCSEWVSSASQEIPCSCSVRWVCSA